MHRDTRKTLSFEPSFFGIEEYKIPSCVAGLRGKQKKTAIWFVIPALVGRFSKLISKSKLKSDFNY